MILVGSRAARFIFPEFREPRADYDSIALEDEYYEIKSNNGIQITDEVPGKLIVMIQDIRMEIEIAVKGNSSFEVYPFSDRFVDVPGIGRVGVANPEVLLLFKQSHVCFQHAWEKTFKDYKFLRSKIRIPEWMEPILDLRIQETKKRINFKERDFEVTNNEFFQKSAHAVRRFMPHDQIHEFVKFGNVPMFTLLKDDLGMAQISYSRFLDFSFSDKIKNMQEEAMVLALERYILPSVVDGIPFSEKLSCLKIMKQLCYNYLPFNFRQFAVDNFNLILGGIPIGFSDDPIEYLKNTSVIHDLPDQSFLNS